MEWETVIGLEIHAQLNTLSKIFSGASTAYGAEPNSQACLVDLGYPGQLPVLNAQAVAKAVKFGLATGSKVARRSVFARKNYFYPDLPKGYQISQFELPIVEAGKLEVVMDDGSIKIVGLTRAHLEEDAGKSLHEGDFRHGVSGIDLNRAGTPLIEIVSEPDMSNAEEAIAFAKRLHSIVTSIGICDGEMSQGSMRFDVNVSVRPTGTTELGTRTETKNLNSYKFMEEAITKEVERQIDLIEDGGTVMQETRLYNGDTKVARSMRSKEEANDYRYFPCPDLLPVIVSDETIEELRRNLPELPDARQARFIEQYGLSDYDAAVIGSDAAMAAYFEIAAAKSANAKLAANWTMGELAARLNSQDLSISKSPVTAEQLGGLVMRIADNSISGKMAKEVFEAMWAGEGSADQIIDARGLKQVSDTGALEKMVVEVLATNQAMVDDYINSDETKRKKKLGGFMGKIMQASKGQANPQQVNQILAQKLNELL